MNYHYYESPSSHPGYDYSRRVLLIGYLSTPYDGFVDLFGSNPWLSDFPLATIGSHH